MSSTLQKLKDAEDLVRKLAAENVDLKNRWDTDGGIIARYEEWLNHWKTVHEYVWEKYGVPLSETLTKRFDQHVSKLYVDRYRSAEFYQPLWTQHDKHEDLVPGPKPLRTHAEPPPPPRPPSGFVNLTPRNVHTFQRKDWDLLEQCAPTYLEEHKRTSLI